MLPLRPARRILLTTDAVGGVWRYAIELAHGLSRFGCQVTLAVLGPPPNEPQCNEAANVRGLELIVTDKPLDWTAESPASLQQAARHLACLAGRIGVDLVQLHTPALTGACTWPTPLVVMVHSCVGTWWRAMHGGALPPDLAWRAAAVADGLAAADAIIVPSAAFAASLRNTYQLRRSLHVIPNGRRVVPSRGARRPIVLTAGRLWDACKGAATLDAAARLLSHPVYAAGSRQGPTATPNQDFPHLILLGELDEAALAGWYAQAAIFASVSCYEPFGLAVLEAAQHGCALVLSDIPTFRELWDDAAVFVPPHDPVALANACAALLANTAAEFGRLAQQRAARFTPDRMAAATWTVHNAVLAREAV